MINTPIELNTEENYCTLKINPGIYPLEIIYCAAYVFIDKAYVILDGDPGKEIEVILKPKDTSNNESLNNLGHEFYNELLNYAVYYQKSKSSRAVRDAIIQKALLTNEMPYVPALESESSSNKSTIKSTMDQQNEDEAIAKELERLEKEASVDIKDIAVPWEEKYGKKTSKDSEDNNPK